MLMVKYMQELQRHSLFHFDLSSTIPDTTRHRMIKDNAELLTSP